MSADADKRQVWLPHRNYVGVYLVVRRATNQEPSHGVGTLRAAPCAREVTPDRLFSSLEKHLRLERKRLASLVHPRLAFLCGLPGTRNVFLVLGAIDLQPGCGALGRRTYSNRVDTSRYRLDKAIPPGRRKPHK